MFSPNDPHPVILSRLHLGQTRRRAGAESLSCESLGRASRQAEVQVLRQKFSPGLKGRPKNRRDPVPPLSGLGGWLGPSPGALPQAVTSLAFSPTTTPATCLAMVSLWTFRPRSCTILFMGVWFLSLLLTQALLTPVTLRMDHALRPTRINHPF
jgi:hypothetical protein